MPVRLGAGPGWIAGACLLGIGVASLVVSVAIVKSRNGRGNGMGRRIRRRFMPRNNTGIEIASDDTTVITRKLRNMKMTVRLKL